MDACHKVYMTIVVLGLIGGSWVSLYVGADLGLYILGEGLEGRLLVLDACLEEMLRDCDVVLLHQSDW